MSKKNKKGIANISEENKKLDIINDEKKEENNIEKIELDKKNNESQEIEEKEIGEIGKIIKNEIKRKLPEDKRKKIIKIILINMGVSILISVYFLFIIMGFKNIEKNIFIVDLKVFTISLSALTIFLFEKYYKKQEKDICIFGVEILIISFVTMILEYIYILNSAIFLQFTITLPIAIIIYYILKSLTIYLYEKRKFERDIAMSNYNESNKI